MTLLSLDAFRDRANELYRADAGLRAAEARAVQVRHSAHEIALPPAMLGRMQIVKSGVLRRKLNLFKSVNMDERGSQILLAPVGTTQKAQRERERAQRWAQGQFRRLTLANATEEPIVEDCGVRGRMALCCWPMPQAWRDAPTLDLDSLMTLDVPEIERRIVETEEAQRRHERTTPPFVWRWVPAQSFVWRDDPRDGEPAEVCEYQTLSVLDILDLYRDEHGKPKAQSLSGKLSARELSPTSRRTVVTRADREHIQIGLVALRLEDDTQRPDASDGTDEECILYQGEHGMGCVPYAIGTGRRTTAADPARRFEGLLNDDVIGLQVALDYAETQIGSNVRFIAWPSPVIERHQDAPPAQSGEGDSPAAVQLQEGAINDVLDPGARIVSPQLMNAQDAALMRDYAARLREYLDDATIPETSGDSGYQEAIQQARADYNVRPFRIGLERFDAKCVTLLFRAAAALLRDGCAPIPAPYVSEDGLEYVTLTEDLAEQSWEITARRRILPVGGEMAAAQTQAFLEEKGYQDHTTSMEKLGDWSPQRTQQKIRAQRLIEEFTQDDRLKEAVWARFLANRAQEAPANAPAGGSIPLALAQTITDPALQAALPEGARGSQLPPAPAGPAPDIAGLLGPGGDGAGRSQQGFGMGGFGTGGGGGGGGNPTGQALAQPGGGMRMTDVLGRNGAA